MNWRQFAACRGLNTNMFYSRDGHPPRSGEARRQEQAAKAVCAECPVIAACLRWAMTLPEVYGVWGGLSAEERQQRQTTPG